MKCRYCNSENCIKKGKTRTVDKSKERGKSFILDGFNRFYNEEFKKNAMKLYFEWNSLRAVSILLNI